MRPFLINSFLGAGSSSSHELKGGLQPGQEASSSQGDTETTTHVRTRSSQSLPVLDSSLLQHTRFLSTSD